jgi:hypothetical protein
MTPHVAAQPNLLDKMSEEELKTTKITPTAVEPGAFQKQIHDMSAGATINRQTTQPAIIEIQPTPSTKPFEGINISSPPAPTPPQQAPKRNPSSVDSLK